MFLRDKIRDALDFLFGTVLGKGIVLGGTAAVFASSFVLINIGGETATCNINGFSDFNDRAGICELKADEKYASNIIIVSGNTANSPKPSITKEDTIYGYLKNSIAKNAKIKVISVSPDLTSNIIENKNEKTNSANSFIEKIENGINNVNQSISQSPKSNGATYFEAIAKAGRDAVTAKQSLKTEEKNDKNNDGVTVIVLGSGLSDGGVLNFADNNLLTRSTPEIIDSLEKANQLSRNLEGVKIIWAGIGQVTTPQENPSEDIETIKDIYRTVLERKGASVDFRDTTVSSSSLEDNPYTVKPTPIFKEITFEYPESELGFKAYSHTVSDEKAAINALSEAINSAKANPGRKVVVTGYMASDKCTNDIDTSLAGLRANTVKDLLVKSGVTNVIETINGGIFKPEEPHCIDGVWKEELAAYRRKVEVKIK